jgi:hypothetical protein
MSGESALHVRLVERLITAVEERYSLHADLMVFADHHSFGRDRPPTIGVFTPDLFASRVPSTFHVIGEAKTPSDLESDRSHRQLEAFLDHLALYPGSALILAVPWTTAPRARHILKRLRGDDHAGVATEILACA